MLREISVPETKPATEWVNGRALQKVSPQRRNARAQSGLCAALTSWARESGVGEVGTEWEFRVTPPGEVTRPLVPDIAFVSYDRFPYEDDERFEIPYMAPDVAVEILSPSDRLKDVEEKIRVYLSSGARLVLIVDPEKRTFTVQDGGSPRVLDPDDTFTHYTLPGFAVRVGSIFEKPRPKS